MKPVFKKFLEINSFFSNIVIPLLGLVIYSVSFGYLSSRFQLEGVNYYFADKLAKFGLFILIVAILILVGLLRVHSEDRLSFKKDSDGLQLVDAAILLLPLTPVVQYVLSNQEILSPQSSFYVLLLFTTFSALYIFALPMLLRPILSTRMLMILGAAFVFTIASMASISAHYAWFEKGAFRKQVLVLVIVFLLIWLFYYFNKKKVLYLFLVLSLVVNVSSQLISQKAGTKDSVARLEDNKLLTMIGTKRPAVTPNIYLLLYDAYVPNETMLAYGIDNSAQENYLREQGFTLYPHTYSTSAFTVGTMSRVLNASNQFYGNIRRGVSGDGVVQRIVKRLGYQTYGLFPYDFMFQGIGSSYDFSIPREGRPPYIQLVKAISLGEFRFDIENVGFDPQTRDQFLMGKRNVFANVAPKPMFVYMHTDLPSHTQVSGVCLPNETDLFRERLREANIEMQQDLALIVKKDPEAIVIVAGDHGPHLTKNCTETGAAYNISEITRLDIQDRHGTFLAIRWPTQDFHQYDDITVLQDLFPAIFAYLYKDPTLLESKVEPVIPPQPNGTISGASVVNGIIHGGIDDGEPLYLADR